MLTLHLDKHFESLLVILIISMTGASAWDKDTLILAELRFITHTHGFLMIDTLDHQPPNN